MVNSLQRLPFKWDLSDSFQPCDKNKIDPQEFNDLVQALSYLDQPEEIPEPIVVEVIDSAETFIILGGHLYEDDLTGDDDLGQSLKNVYLPDFNGSLITVNFNGDGNIAEAVFVITPLDK